MNLNNNHSFNIELAQLVGVEKALLLGRVWLYIDYHKRNGTNLRDDKFWMYDSSTALAEVYPYMTPQSIRRRMAELEKDGWLVSGNYNRKSNDLTKWYALGATFISWIKNENLPAQNEQANNNNEILEEIKPAQNERLHNQAEIFPAQIEQTPAQNEQSIAQNEQPLPIISYCNPVVTNEYTPENITSSFSNPTQKEVEDYFEGQLYPREWGTTFWAHYDSIGWITGPHEARIKNWKSRVGFWVNNQKQFGDKKNGTDQSVSKGSVKSRLDYKPDYENRAKRIAELKLITGES